MIKILLVKLYLTINQLYFYLPIHSKILNILSYFSAFIIFHMFLAYQVKLLFLKLNLSKLHIQLALIINSFAFNQAKFN